MIRWAYCEVWMGKRFSKSRHRWKRLWSEWDRICLLRLHAIVHRFILWWLEKITVVVSRHSLLASRDSSHPLLFYMRTFVSIIAVEGIVPCFASWLTATVINNFSSITSRTAEIEFLWEEAETEGIGLFPRTWFLTRWRAGGNRSSAILALEGKKANAYLCNAFPVVLVSVVAMYRRFHSKAAPTVLISSLIFPRFQFAVKCYGNTAAFV